MRSRLGSASRYVDTGERYSDGYGRGALSGGEGGYSHGSDTGYRRHYDDVRASSPVGYRSDADRSDHDSLYVYSPGARSDRYRGESEGERGWRPPGSSSYGAPRTRYVPRSLRSDDPPARYGTPSRGLAYGDMGDPSPYSLPTSHDRGQPQRYAPVEPRSVEQHRATTPRTLHDYSSFLLEEIAKTKSDNAWLQREIDLTREDNVKLRMSHTSIDGLSQAQSPTGSPDRHHAQPSFVPPPTNPRAVWRMRLRDEHGDVRDVDVPAAATVADLAGCAASGAAVSLSFAGRQLHPHQAMRAAGLRDGDAVDFTVVRASPRRRSPSPPVVHASGATDRDVDLRDSASSVPTDASAERAAVAELLQQEREEEAQRERRGAALTELRPTVPATAVASTSAAAPAVVDGVRVAEEREERERQEREQQEREQQERERREAEQQAEVQRAEAERRELQRQAALEQRQQEQQLRAADAAAERMQAEEQRKKEQGASMFTALVRSQNQRSGASVICYVDGASVFKGEYQAHLQRQLDDIAAAVDVPRDAPKPAVPAPDINSQPADVARYNQQARQCFYSFWLPLRKKQQQQG